MEDQHDWIATDFIKVGSSMECRNCKITKMVAYRFSKFTCRKDVT